MASDLPSDTSDRSVAPTRGGWSKSPRNPILGGDLGACSDAAVLREGEKFRLWFSWRRQRAIGLAESEDGVDWGDPQVVLAPQLRWEELVNRISVLKRPEGYRMWYTGQVVSGLARSVIGYATSPDGVTWKRHSDRPVLSPQEPWEKSSVMCPHVLCDDTGRFLRMWYSGGEQRAPDAIGYATSPGGIFWTKLPTNPVFLPDPRSSWEQQKVAACQVIRHDQWYLMFYVGLQDAEHAHIGLARSRNGISGWLRHPANPILSPSGSEWDGDAVCQPFALFDEKQKLWRLWYTGRRGDQEQIGLALHEGEDLGF